MIIAITRDNEKLVNYVCDILGENAQIYNGVNNLKKFAIQDARNLNSYSHIVIDLIGINDTEDDIVDAIVALRSMYNIKIIIIATGYEYGNTLLSKLFNEGIYNFITTTDSKQQEKELIECIQNGRQYKDSVRYRVAELENRKDDGKIILKKEYKKLKQCVTIGIAGTQHHIGVTSQAIAVTKFLNDIQMNACYIQANKSEDIDTLETFFDVEVKEGFISLNGIDMYQKDKTINAMDYGYDFYIYDMGVLSELSDIDSFIMKDVKIIVGGTKSWEQNNLMSVFELLGDSININYIFNFTSGSTKDEVARNMGKLGAKTYFSNYMPDPFIVDSNEKEYHELLNDYIAEKSIKTEIIPIEKKKGFFEKLVGRRK